MTRIVGGAPDLASPPARKDILVKGAGTDFDPSVIDAFLVALQKGEMEVAGGVV